MVAEATIVINNREGAIVEAADQALLGGCGSGARATAESERQWQQR